MRTSRSVERLLAAKASKSLCGNIRAPIKQTFEWLIDDRALALHNPAVRLHIQATPRRARAWRFRGEPSGIRTLDPLI